MRPARTSFVGLVALLAGLTVIFAALPAASGLVPWACLSIAALAALCSVLNLLVQGISALPPVAETVLERWRRYLITGVRSAPWAEVMTVAVLVLEAEHAHQPWHTGVLLIALLGYLLAVHLAETGAAPGTLRAQLPPLAAGIGLAVLAIGAGEVRGLSAGPVATTVRIIAAAAAVTAIGLVVPVWLSKDS